MKSRISEQNRSKSWTRCGVEDCTDWTTTVTRGARRPGNTRGVKKTRKTGNEQKRCKNCLVSPLNLLRRPNFYVSDSSAWVERNQITVNENLNPFSPLRIIWKSLQYEWKLSVKSRNGRENTALPWLGWSIKTINNWSKAKPRLWYLWGLRQ